MNYLNVASRVFNTPLLCTSSYASQISSVILPRVTGQPALELDEYDSFPDKEREETGPKVAVIPVYGSLVNRSGRVSSNSTRMRSYHSIRDDVEAAVNDESISEIVLDVDSPGGEVIGCRECAEFIAESAKKKPIHAVAEGHMCSAAYYLCAGATNIYATRSSRVGSIGAVVIHADISEQLKSEGVTPTVIKSGKHKDMMSSLRPMTDEEKAQVQAHVDNVAGEFMSFVSAHRDIDSEDLRSLEAGVLGANKSKKEGLIDGIKSFDQLISEISNQRGDDMPTEKKEGGVDMASLEQMKTDAYAMGYEEGRAAGAADAKKRMSAVMALPEAEGREEMAMSMAVDTDIPVEAAAKVMAKAPKAAPQTQDLSMPSILSAAMATQQEEPIVHEEPAAMPGGVDLSSFEGAFNQMGVGK